MNCERNICYGQDYNGGCETCPCNEEQEESMSKYKAGDKFILEIKDIRSEGVYVVLENENDCISMPEFMLDGFPREETSKTYEDGLADAWEAAEKIQAGTADGGLPANAVQALFGCCNPFIKFTPQEAIAKIKEWEESKEIKRGDEVKDNVSATKGIVTRVDADGEVLVLWTRGNANYEKPESITKTGRNFADKLDALLEDIGDE